MYKTQAIKLKRIFKCLRTLIIKIYAKLMFILGFKLIVFKTKTALNQKKIKDKYQ